MQNQLLQENESKRVDKVQTFDLLKLYIDNTKFWEIK